LAGFIDQARLFRTLGAVTNKLHFLHSLAGFLVDWLTWNAFGTARGEIQLPMRTALHPFILWRVAEASI
jgi:hypothetical protein